MTRPRTTPRPAPPAPRTGGSLVSHLTRATARDVAAIAGHLPETSDPLELAAALRSRAAEREALARRNKSDAMRLREWALSLTLHSVKDPTT